MRPTEPGSAAFSGWPRELVEGLRGPLDEARILGEVTEALRLEQRATTRAQPLRVDEVRSLAAEQPDETAPGLWVLSITLPTRTHLRDWQGAVLVCELTDRGQPWRAEVLEVDLRRRRLVVCGTPEEPPLPGPARALPFDFLRAAITLATSPRLASARRPWTRLLGAALGSLTPTRPLELGGHDARQQHSHAAWTWSWARVWGPPGTGKTHTLVEEVGRILEHPDERVLVVSTTNQATDGAALRLGQQPGGVKRVGSLRIGPFAQAGMLSLLPDPQARLERIQALEARLAAASIPALRASAWVALNRARRGLPRLRDLLAEQGPRCVFTTTHAALGAVTSDEFEPFLHHGHAPFTTVVIDEAGLVPRVSAAAIALLAARQVVLVGDPRQLSPICVAARSMDSKVKRWLAASAMEGTDLGQPATQPLMRQYRMHPDISRAVSLFQYEGKLDDAYEVRGRELPAPLAGRLSGWPRAAWIVLDRCEGEDLTSVAADRSGNRSWVRPAGLEVLSRLFDRYPELARLDGMFISPFRGQADRARQLLDAHGLGHWTASTVHAQQGSEADIVVFDLVRHGGWSKPDWKRLVNVALSRARYQLLVLAAEPELAGQAGCSGLVEALQPCSVGLDGTLQAAATTHAQQSIFGRLSTTIGGQAEEPQLRSASRAHAERDEPAGDPSALGTQILHSRAARRSLTRVQAQLVRRDLVDLGPRIVRGVAGSGKTIVLARWAAVELNRHADRDVTVVYGNTALRGHLERLIEQAWRVTVDNPRGEAPWSRIQLLHVGQLLRDLLTAAGLPLPQGSAGYDYDAQAAQLRAVGLAPRFGLLYLDEAQDLGHETLALLVSLVRPAPDPEQPERSLRPVRIFYDNAQNVYRRSTPRWSDVGLDMRGRSVVLRDSFRSTRAAMKLALDTVDELRPLETDPDLRELISPRSGQPLLVRDADGGWQPEFCVVDGQPPQVAFFDSNHQELVGLVRRVSAWLADGIRPRDVRVLAPRWRRCELLAEALRTSGIPAVAQRNTSMRPDDPRVLVTTPQSFKGHEAELVAVVGVQDYVARSRGEVLVSALYVAMTRARTWMWVSGVRSPLDERGALVVAAVEAAAARQVQAGNLERAHPSS